MVADAFRVWTAKLGMSTTGRRLIATIIDRSAHRPASYGCSESSIYFWRMKHDVDQASWLKRSVRRHFDPDRHAPLGQVGDCTLMAGKLLNLLANFLNRACDTRRARHASTHRNLNPDFRNNRALLRNVTNDVLAVVCRDRGDQPTRRHDLTGPAVNVDQRAGNWCWNFEEPAAQT